MALINGNRVDKVKGSLTLPQQTTAKARWPIAQKRMDRGRGPPPIEGSGLVAEDRGAESRPSVWELRHPRRRLSLSCLHPGASGSQVSASAVASSFPPGLQRAPRSPRRLHRVAGPAPPCRLRGTPGGRHTSCRWPREHSLATHVRACPGRGRFELLGGGQRLPGCDSRGPRRGRDQVRVEVQLPSRHCNPAGGRSSGCAAPRVDTGGRRAARRRPSSAVPGSITQAAPASPPPGEWWWPIAARRRGTGEAERESLGPRGPRPVGGPESSGVLWVMLAPFLGSSQRH